jgi:hypothetical protein
MLYGIVSMIHFLYIYARFTTTTPVILTSMYRFIALLCLCSTVFGQRKMEYLNRGIVVVRHQQDSVFLSWRLLATDPEQVAFNIYRNQQLQNRQPLTKATCFTAAWTDSLCLHPTDLSPGCRTLNIAWLLPGKM